MDPSAKPPSKPAGAIAGGGTALRWALALAGRGRGRTTADVPRAGQKASPMQIAATGAASARYLMSSPSSDGSMVVIRPMTSGAMSAARIQPANVAHASHAARRTATLTATTITAATTDSQARNGGVPASTYEVTGYHCQGPPNAPGTNESLSKPATNVRTPPTDWGACGWAIEDPRATPRIKQKP